MEQRKQILTELMIRPMCLKAKELAILLNIQNHKDGDRGAGRPGGRRKDRCVEKGKYGKPETFSSNGIFRASQQLWLVTVDGMEQDIFIPEDRTGAAMHGDRVQIVVESEAVRSGHSKSGMGASGRRAEVIKVLEHANKEVVGYYQKNKSFGFVIPDNQKLAKDVLYPRAVIWGLSPGTR